MALKPQALVPTTQLWEGTRITVTVSNGLWQGAAAQSPFRLGQILAGSPLLFCYSCKRFRSGGSSWLQSSSSSHLHLESQSWLIRMKRGEIKNIVVFYLPAVSSEFILFQWRKNHPTHFKLFFFWQIWDSPWTVSPDLTWRLEEHTVQPDQSKPSLPIRFTVRFHKIALPSHIKPAENVFFFFSFYKPEEEAKPIH